MANPISSISQKTFPPGELISGKSIHNAIMKEIQKDFPSFNEGSSLSLSELEHYRQQYIRSLMSEDGGAIGKEVERDIDQMAEQDEDKQDAKITTGQKWADRIANFGGSWRFIGIFCSFLVLWMIVNVLLLLNRAFDPYPFILLNLILSCIAALQAPLIMMSQNRQEEKDRERAKNDYKVNLKSELEIRMLHEKIDYLIISHQEQITKIDQEHADKLNELSEQVKNIRGST